MLISKGKYNTANIMIDSVESGLIQQLYLMLNHLFIKKRRDKKN